MILDTEIREIVKSKIKKIGGYLVDVKVSHTNDITVLIDRIEGVTFAHCSKISKYIESKFDRDQEDYSLTVCSPGLDRAFLVKEQYEKNLGKDVKVLLKNGKRKSGKMLKYDDVLILEKASKNKSLKSSLEKIIISKDEIKETKLKINFK